MGVLHSKSTAVKVIRESGAGLVLDFNGDDDLDKIENGFSDLVSNFKLWRRDFDPAKINTEVFDQYSARSITKILAGLLDSAMMI